MRRTHLQGRDHPVCFSRGAERGVSSADLGAVDCTRCLSLVDQVRRAAAAMWAYHLKFGRRPPVEVEACPECKSRQLCEPDCSVAPWNQESVR